MIGVLWAALGFFGCLGLTVVGDMVSEEVSDRLDRLPQGILRLAAARINPQMRAMVYDDEWLPELIYILKGDEARPVTRLFHGICFSLSILLSARRIDRQLSRSPARRDVVASTTSMAIGLDLRHFVEARGRPTSRAEKAVWNKMVDRLMSEFGENPQTIKPVLVRCQGLEFNIAELARFYSTRPDSGLFSQALICYIDLKAVRNLGE